MKRKSHALNDDANGSHSEPRAKKKHASDSDSSIHSRFRDGLFDPAVLEQYTRSYKASQPYKHGVIPSLISDPLLRNVRHEIQQHLSFTPKETDIYKIHQSGDLANLDGLDDASLALLPSLRELRDALYSAPFRQYLSNITGAGELSGKKTDMAINVYTEGCHLLCHDDVIGSRRVSYILYLTDPERPWREEWGGALRLYPTVYIKGKDGKTVNVPSPDFTVAIPPAFNQLSFFAVQPGESFHDVEEVYHHAESEEKDERVRMAISGWYHIPQDGEEEYEEGLEEKLAEKSSLAQLQGNADEFDLPQPKPVAYENASPSEVGREKYGDSEEVDLTEADLNHLLMYMSPTYLTPDAAEELEERFSDDSSLVLDQILSDKFAGKMREYIQRQEQQPLPKESDELEKSTLWRIARPPHKHRYLFQQPSMESKPATGKDVSPLQDLLDNFLPSQSFTRWLRLVTGCSKFLTHDFTARRFRKGQDYQLATNYDGENPRLEITLGLSPGFVDAEDENNAADVVVEEVGGYEVYMGGDDDDDDDEEEEENEHEVKNGAKKRKDDPAVYRAAANEDDDGILLSMPAAWNKMSLVLRDKGTMKFVKYLGRKAASDRWDVSGAIAVDPKGWEEGE